MGFNEPVAKVTELVQSLIAGYSFEGPEHSLLEFQATVDIAPKLQSIFNELTTLYSVSDADADEATRTKIEAFEKAAVQQSKEFVFQMGFAKATDEVLKTFLQEHHLHLEDERVTFRDFKLSSYDFTTIEKLCLILDAVIILSQMEDFLWAKNTFYTLLQTILETFAGSSTDMISTFWFYLERRVTILSQTVFDSKVTLDRIAILGFCNGLTDKLYLRDKTGKLNSYRKDTFNDMLQARVRTFLATLLEFDDLTGLNKYFALANRVSNEPNLWKAKSGDDELLQDILHFYKLIRDPYTFLKNQRALTSQVDAIDRLHKYLLDEEAKYARRHPKDDVHKLKRPFSEESQQLLAEKYLKAVVVPEHYWLSPFEPVQRGLKYDSVKQGDQAEAIKQLDVSKHRRLLLYQMYFVCSFFVELLSSRKKALLQANGAPASTKHITDDSTPDQLVGKLLYIKNNIPRQLQAFDAQCALMVLKLSASEELWWGWLMYAKLKDSKPLLARNSISADEISAAVAKFESAYQYKTKRYFNSHVTPQLSRRMKAKTGLSLLKSKLAPNYAEDLPMTDEEAAVEDTPEARAERIVVMWKKLRYMRPEHWLELTTLLDTKVLGEDKPTTEIEKDGAKIETNEVEGSDEQEAVPVEMKQETTESLTEKVEKAEDTKKVEAAGAEGETLSHDLPSQTGQEDSSRKRERSPEEVDGASKRVKHE